MKKRGIIEMFSAAFLWGSTPIMSILSHLPSGVFVFFRVVFAFPFLLYFAIKKTGIKEFFKLRPFWPIFLSGIMLSFNWIFLFWAVNFISVSTVIVMYYTGPIFTIILSVIFLKEKLTINLIIAMFFALLGVIFSVKGEIEVNKFVFIALLSGVFYGFLGFFSKIATKYHKALDVTAWQVFISIFLTFPFLFINNYHITIQGIVVSAVTGVVHTALALFLWYDSLNYIKLSAASIIAFTDLFFAMILAWLILGQVPNIYQITGGFLVFLAGVFMSMGEIRKRK
ncbi:MULTISPECIES: DMT family transporter [unclassified Lebetimonas]|uniref:DMT family transporter n=1 Tax=unclassified Lebetimonas TaxID=2648158 RepID=UPI000464F8DF|nr:MULTISPECIES: DMT family transporter [unclassified Lebetimonas]